MHRKPYLLAAALLSALALSAVLVWMIYDRATILRDGREIVLKTEPIDPRDLLRGSYVRLNYSISQLETSLLPAGAVGALKAGDAILVHLRAGADGYWVATGASAEMPAQTQDDEVWIRGELGATPSRNGNTVRVKYGIERFYTPESAAPEIEKRMRKGELTDIVVAVGPDGRAQIKALRQGDETIYTERLF